jgi:L-amino acid N-acyltransferase YncA
VVKGIRKTRIKRMMKYHIQFLENSWLSKFADYLDSIPYFTYSDNVILDEKDVLSFKYYHGNTYVLATDENREVLGHICVIHPVNKHGYHQEHILEVHINVLPTHHGKSIGKRLLEFFLKEVKKGNKKRGIKKIHTKMLANNDKVIKLFESLGFKKEAVLKKEWKLLIKDKKGKDKEVYEDGVYMSLFLN